MGRLPEYYLRVGEKMRSGLRRLLISFSIILFVAAANVAVLGKSAVAQAAQGDKAQPKQEDKPQPSAYGPVYEIGKHVSAPHVLYAPVAKFPKMSKKDKRGIRGVVLIRLIVDRDGMPQDPHVLRSFRADFDAEALKAVKQYRFEPAKRFQEPVAVFLMVEVNFARD